MFQALCEQQLKKVGVVMSVAVDCLMEQNPHRCACLRAFKARPLQAQFGETSEGSAPFKSQRCFLNQGCALGSETGLLMYQA